MMIKTFRKLMITLLNNNHSFVLEGDDLEEEQREFEEWKKINSLKVSQSETRETNTG